ncbi:copper resistance protein NlpE N-terminal domain-containing protein [uncultured Bacteroides sp.]|uniref:copper resistance protein NlpE N-terminal domain-containing protein n=1 Tax=uncultured Bacteroides sp. TaxID=162156 RepID=UPI002AAB1F17|nr:copper resistance protein NlpE N-terminal domain-containing protein [uncultured Bacteroides sp.]
MKKLFFILVLGAMVSCQQKAKDVTATEGAAKDSTEMKLDPALGALQTKTFEGVLPSQGKGLRYTLTVKIQEKSDNGQYELLRTYIEGNEGKDLTYVTKGTVKTIHGTEADKRAIVWELTPEKNKEISYYQVESDKVIMLSQKMKKTPDWKKYVLSLKK